MLYRDFTAYVRNSTSTGSFQVKCTYEVIDGDAICGTRVAVHHNTADPSDDWLRIDLSPESISSSLNGGNSIQTAISSTYMAVYHATMVSNIHLTLSLTTDNIFLKIQKHNEIKQNNCL